MLIDDPTGTPPPEGYPTYDSPVVQAVAAELLGRPYDDAAYWHKPHESNRASALHAAVRAVHAVLSLSDEPEPTDLSEAVAAELRHTTDTKVRVLRPGSKVGRTLYDAETGDLVGMVDSPELAEWLCETVWREVRSQALREGERPVARELVAQLDERYGLDGPRDPSMDDAMTTTYGGTEPRDEECRNVASAPDRYQLSGVEGVDAVELGILLGSRSLVAVVDNQLRRPVAWAHFLHAGDVARSLSTFLP